MTKSNTFNNWFPEGGGSKKGLNFLLGSGGRREPGKGNVSKITRRWEEQARASPLLMPSACAAVVDLVSKSVQNSSTTGWADLSSCTAAARAGGFAANVASEPGSAYHPIGW